MIRRDWNSKIDLSFNVLTEHYIVGLWDPDLQRRVTVEIPCNAYIGRPNDASLEMQARGILAARKRRALFKPNRHEQYKDFRKVVFT